MLVSSATVSTTTASASLLRDASSKPAQLVLRGTRDGDLAATLLSSSSQTSSSSSAAAPNVPAERKPLFTWANLLTIVSTGNLQKLSRHPDDLREYLAWTDSIKSTYGTVHAFLLAERFTATKLLEKASSSHTSAAPTNEEPTRCFREWFEPGKECQILRNDWPYSVPQDVTHFVVWSHLAILHPDLVENEEEEEEEVKRIAWGIIAKRGLCGTLTRSQGLRLPSIEDHSLHLPHLKAEFEAGGEATKTKVEKVLTKACGDLVSFIKKHWDVEGSKEGMGKEAVFFANPPSLQSVPSLAHFHVLIKQA